MNILRVLLSRFSRDMGIDLGTANTLVHVRGEGIVLREPSVVAIDSETKKVLAVGEEAKRMLGRTPGTILAIRPLKDGVIADFEQTEKMIRYFIAKVHRRTMLVAPRVVIGVPSGVTEVEERAVKEAAQKGGRERGLYHRRADGRGYRRGSAGLRADRIDDRRYRWRHDGSRGHFARRDRYQPLGTHRRRRDRRSHHQLCAPYLQPRHIGDRTAEEAKFEVGSAYPVGPERTMEVRGRDLISGLPRRTTIYQQRDPRSHPGSDQLNHRSGQGDPEGTPPELSADIYERGIVLAGGGALLEGLDQLLRETAMPVHVAEDPLSCVVLGTGRVLEALDNNPSLRKVLKQ